MEIAVYLTRAEIDALLSTLDHGDIAYGISWREIASKAERDARETATQKLEAASRACGCFPQEERR